MKAQKISRRTFLEASAALCSLPMLVSGRVLGKDGFFPPSETINVGLIGWGTRRSNVGSRPGARFVACCDIDVRRIPKEMDGHPVKGFQYYQEMYEMPELDVVSIAAPDHWHTRMTIDACKKGKDVYCEKPLTFTLMESRQIVAAARKYDRVVSSGSQRVMEDYGQYMAPIIMSGAIGEVKEIYANCGGAPSERTYDPEPCPPEVDWDAWVETGAVIILAARFTRAEWIMSRPRRFLRPIRNKTPSPASRSRWKTASIFIMAIVRDPAVILRSSERKESISLAKPKIFALATRWTFAVTAAARIILRTISCIAFVIERDPSKTSFTARTFPTTVICASLPTNFSEISFGIKTKWNLSETVKRRRWYRRRKEPRIKLKSERDSALLTTR